MKVLKTKGKTEEFNSSKIKNAITKAFASQYSDIEIYTKEIDFLMNVILNEINKLNLECIPIDTIQNIIEDTLMLNKYTKVAKAFIIYRNQHQESRFIRDRIDYMDKYSNSKENAASSSETDANANITMKNVANLEGEVYKTTNRIIQRQRMKDKLNELYPEVAKQYEKDLNNHIIYAHDESQTPALKAYCMAATLYPLMNEGTGNIDGVTPSAPNDINSFSGQVTNLMFLLSSQVRGAVAMGDYIIALNYYVIKEFGENWYTKLNCDITTPHNLKHRNVRDAIKKGMKQFIYGINQPAGNRSYNSPFSNLNFFDKYYYKALFENFYYPDNTQPKWEAVDTLQRIFMELLRELRLKKPLTFPVTSVCMLHNNEDCLDLETKNWVCEEWAKGSSFFLYLSNNPNSVSSCCRVQNEITENTFNSTTGLTGIMTGSCNVITLNINRIVQDWYREYSPQRNKSDKGVERKMIAVRRLWDKEGKNLLRQYINNILERVYKYHIAYKTMLYDMEDLGMYSSSNAGYIYMKKLYCTIGVIGYCEAAEFLGIECNNNEQYKEFLQLIFSTIQEENKKHSIHNKKRPFIFNTEAIPGENLAVKLYEVDKEDGYFVPKDQNLYSSYFFKQWDANISVLDKIKLHGRKVNQYCGGGQAAHIHLEEHLSKEQYIKLLNLAIKEGCNYFTYNIPMSECKDCGHIVNAPIKKCPKCNSTNIDWWIRIIGFLRPMSTWSTARQIEGNKRVYSKNIE